MHRIHMQGRGCGAGAGHFAGARAGGKGTAPGQEIKKLIDKKD